MKNNSQNINLGSSSILMIFVVLCLVCFAALSLISANSDYRLSEEFATKTRAYYEASNTAESSIASIDQSLSQSASTMDETTYFETLGSSIFFQVSITDQQSLYVELTPLYPDNKQALLYEIEEYRIITPNPLEADMSIEFFTP